MTTTRPGRRPPMQRLAAPPGLALWREDMCLGGCLSHRRGTAVLECVNPAYEDVTTLLCPRCLWRQLSRQLNRSAGAGGIWDLAVCEDHPPEKVPTLPHDGRLVCSDCLTGSGGLLGPPLSSSW